MMRNPPGSNRGWTNFTFTDPKLDPPVLTAWGEARFKEAKDSNGGNYRLDETNDPVLTKCYPPGVPRVYFHPYPFEVVHTPKVTLLVYEYDHTLRRVFTDGRKLVPDELVVAIKDDDRPPSIARQQPHQIQQRSIGAPDGSVDVALDEQHGAPGLPNPSGADRPVAPHGAAGDAAFGTGLRSVHLMITSDTGSASSGRACR